MDVLSGIISEEEVQDMPVETLKAFLDILDVSMCDMLVQYMENPEANLEVVNKLQESVGTEILQKTFHLRVKDKGIQRMLFDNTLSTLPSAAYRGDINVDQFIKELEWLDTHVDLMKTTIPGRTMDMYTHAYTLIKEFQDDDNARHTHHIPTLLAMYKDTLFCPKREKGVTTGIRNLTTNKQRWHLQLKAAKYLKYCIDAGIPSEIAREC